MIKTISYTLVLVVALFVSSISGVNDTIYAQSTRPACGIDFDEANCPKPTAVPPQYQRDVNAALGTFNLPNAVKNISTTDEGISDLIGRMITLLFGVSALAVLVMVMWGSFQYITSGGNKDSIAAATQRIKWAIIGIIILSVSFFLLNILGRIINVDFLDIKL